MLKVWVLVIFTSQGEDIEVAAYDQFNDCVEIAHYLNQDMSNGATAACYEGTGGIRPLQGR